MGDYVGHPAEQAGWLVRRLGLRPGMCRSFGCDPDQQGHVIAQHPAPGESTPRNTIVELYIGVAEAAPNDEAAADTSHPRADAEPDLTDAEPEREQQSAGRRKKRLAHSPSLVDTPPAPTPRRAIEDTADQPAPTAEDETQEPYAHAGASSPDAALLQFAQLDFSQEKLLAASQVFTAQIDAQTPPTQPSAAHPQGAAETAEADAQQCDPSMHEHEATQASPALQFGQLEFSDEELIAAGEIFGGHRPSAQPRPPADDRLAAAKDNVLGWVRRHPVLLVTLVLLVGVWASVAFARAPADTRPAARTSGAPTTRPSHPARQRTGAARTPAQQTKPQATPPAPRPSAAKTPAETTDMSRASAGGQPAPTQAAPTRPTAAANTTSTEGNRRAVLPMTASRQQDTKVPPTAADGESRQPATPWRSPKVWWIIAAVLGAGALALAPAGQVHALEAAGAFKGEAISGVAEFIGKLKGNLVWLGGTAMGLIIAVVGIMFMAGHSRAHDLAIRTLIGLAILASISGIVA